VYDGATLPMWMDGNVFLGGAKPSRFDEHSLVLTDFDPGLRLVEKTGGLYFEIKFDRMWMREPHKMVTSTLLGTAVIPDLPYEQPNSSPIRIDADYLGKIRNEANPTPGPFERSSQSDLALRVW